MFERILVPLDGSRLSELSLPYAEELARTLNSEVTLIYVGETADPRHRYEQQVYVEKMAKLLTDNIEEGSKARVKPVVLDGRPASAIIEYAAKNNTSLIIMATHGRSGIMLWAMGDTAHKILHGVSMPVLLIRASIPAPEAGKAGRMFSQIMVPLDGSEAGEAALPYVSELTKKLESEVTLLQVIAPGQHVHTIGGLDYVRFTEQQIESAKASAQQYLDGVSRRFTGTKAKVNSELRPGDPAEVIIKFASETNAQLVAMSSHGYSSIDRWTLGSITNKILHGGKTPLLLVRAPAMKAK